MNLFIYEETSSTNDLAKSLHYRHGDTIWAWHQSAGRGQRGNKWSGGVGSNIAFTVVLEPSFLAASDQFLISQVVAISLREALEEYGICSSIKWTNDIYVGDYKIAGVLIENSLRDGVVARSAVGIGLNINQTIFDPELPNPTSMAIVTGRNFDRESVLKSIHTSLMKWVERLRNGEHKAIEERYHERLYRKGEEHKYRLYSGEVIRASIRGVRPHGELILHHNDGTVGEYLFREVEFIIESRNR